MYRIFCLIVSMITHCAVLDAQSASFPDSTRSCPGCDLRRARLFAAELVGADLRRADLYWANLKRADLRGALLDSADLRGALMHEARIGRVLRCVAFLCTRPI